jgi:hypothetical protein
LGGNKKYSRSGTVRQIIPEQERRTFWSEFYRLKSDYEHSNNDETTLTGGLFTDKAYYLYDITRLFHFVFRLTDNVH